MMKFMLLIYGSEAKMSQERFDECIAKSTAMCHVLEEQGKFVAASPLHPISTATSVRVREGKRQITDGPFAETTEQLGGFYIIDVMNKDEAIEIASRLPPAMFGTVEVRPIHELPNLPDTQKPGNVLSHTVQL